ncbi:hypothetical protein PENTCL1PPCAC_5051, partial [Pristionchus entomophagus]
LKMATSREKHIKLDKEEINQLSRPSTSGSSRSVSSYDDCTSLDVSSNGFASLPHAKMFPKCKRLDVSDNELVRLSSILPLANQLIELNASRNKINNATGILSFKHLQTLNLSSNQLTNLPPFTACLTLLDLSHNQFTHLPPLSTLHQLETLNLSGNEISDLSEAPSLLPSSIKFLNLSSNKIDSLMSLFDLSFLPLSSLCISSNPCILPSKFNHSPFIFALFYNYLVEVDGISLSEEEILIGERMLQDKLSKFKRGGMDKESEVREYLSLHSPPMNSANLNSSFDARMIKVLQKRREHESSMSESSTLPSVHSPYADWARVVLSNKENRSPSRSEEMSSTMTPTPRPLTMEKENEENEGGLVDEEEKKEEEEERKEETPPCNDLRVPPQPKPRRSKDEQMKMAVVVIQRWWRERRDRFPGVLMDEEMDRRREKNELRREEEDGENDGRREDTTVSSPLEETEKGREEKESEEKEREEKEKEKK